MISFLLLVLDDLIIASVLSAILLGIFKITRNSSKAKFRYIVWILFVVSSLIPFKSFLGNGLIHTRAEDMLDSSTYVSEEFKSTQPDTGLTGDINQAVNDSYVTEVGNTNDSLGAFAAHPPLYYILLIASIAWISVAAIIFIKQIYQYRSFIKRINRWREPLKDDKILNIYSQSKKELGLSAKDIPLNTSPLVKSPMLVGLFKPVIILPEIEYSEEELGFILRHELMHYKHKDNFVNLLVMIMVSAYWFNPLIWLVRSDIEDTAESYCDDGVMKDSDENERKSYCQLILTQTIQNSFKEPAIIACLHSRKDSVKKRLLSILSYKSKIKTISTVVVVAAGMVVLFLSPLKLFNIVTAQENLAQELSNHIEEPLTSDELSKSANDKLSSSNNNKTDSTQLMSSQDDKAESINETASDKDIKDNQAISQLNDTSSSSSTKASTKANTSSNNISANKQSVSTTITTNKKPVANTNTSTSSTNKVSASTGSNTGSNTSASSITIGQAKGIALTNAGLTSGQVTFKEAKQDYDNGQKIYELEFEHGNYEYEYKISATTGKIIEKEVDD